MQIEDYLYQKKLHEPLTEAKHIGMKAEDRALLDRQALGAVRLSLAKKKLMRTTIDPVTRREVKGKERMVFNYKSLNDNTYKDQYSLPGINTIIKRIGGAKIFLKFDLKSRFHQVAMDEESISWTTFLVPGGLYEWLVMLFGLKNTPAVLERKMDKCFKGTKSFIAVYIHVHKRVKCSGIITNVCNGQTEYNIDKS
ncbi:retrotransposon protein, putative, ty3-gypsy subclass [Tanacetum coccineum]